MKSDRVGHDSFLFETIKCDYQGQLYGKMTKQAAVYNELLPGGILLQMVRIPPGNFIMGASSNERGFETNETPKHQVNFYSFYLSRYPITQAQWQAILAITPVLQSNQGYHKYELEKNLPITNVSWLEAYHFSQALSTYTNHIYRLPTESEWEYACRAGTTSPFSFGATLTYEIANYDSNVSYGGEKTKKARNNLTEVGIFSANDWGLSDMHGLVWELCFDTWTDNYRSHSSHGHDAKCNTQGDRIMRGGAYSYYPIHCRSASRYFLSPNKRYDAVGFRIAMDEDF